MIRLRSNTASTGAGADAPLPWRTLDGEPGCIVDANGEFVLQIDNDRQRADDVVERLAGVVVEAVNAFGGGTAEAGR